MPLTAIEPTTVSEPRRWAILAASSLAQGSSAVMIHGAAFLIPALHEQLGLSLARAGLVAATPTIGVMLSLVAWGWLADRRGERVVLLAGLASTTVVGALAALSGSLLALSALLLLAGAGAASTSAASGRVVVGWFPPHRRGLAMGIRQMSQPAGVGVAAVTMAVIASAHGPYAALWVPTAATALGLVVTAVVVLDPPRPSRTSAEAPNPYAGDDYLARIHAVGVLLVVPQFVVWTFALVWLVDERGWSPGAAGTLVALTQVAGALGRIGSGQLSDTVRSRVRPMRWVAWTAAAVMAVFGLASGLGSALAIPLLVVAATVTVADNGLSFTAVAERAGPRWSGRSLGLHNTLQFLVSSAVPPLGGLAIAHTGYAWTFAAVAGFAVAAALLAPVAAEHPLQ